jgi:hypothetical protein
MLSLCDPHREISFAALLQGLPGPGNDMEKERLGDAGS